MMIWPPAKDTWEFELWKSVLTACVTVLGLVLTWIIGQRLGASWAVWQKRREAEMATAAEFYRLYGEFVEVWRLWKVVNSDLEGADRDVQRWELLKRATAAEGALEAICIKIATEHRLTDDQSAALGKYRKLYQELRQRIRSGRPLDWDYEKTAYQQFKTYAGQASCILASGAGRPPTPEQATEQLDAITRPRRHELLGEIEETEELNPVRQKMRISRVVDA